MLCDLVIFKNYCSEDISRELLRLGPTSGAVLSKTSLKENKATNWKEIYGRSNLLRHNLLTIKEPVFFLEINTIISYYLVKMTSIVDPQLITTKLEEILSTMNRRFDDLNAQTKRDMDIIRGEVKIVKDDFKKFSQRNDWEKRSKNLVFFGFRSNNYKESIDELINLGKEINIDIRRYDIERVIIMGPQPGNRVIKICFTSSIMRNDIFNGRWNLASSEDWKGIRIKEDLSPEVRKIRDKLFKHLQHFKQLGCRVSYRYDKLLIDGKLATLEDLESGDFSRKRARGEESSPENDLNETVIEKVIDTPRTPKSQKKKPNRGRGGGFKQEGSRLRHNSLDRYYKKATGESHQLQLSSGEAVHSDVAASTGSEDERVEKKNERSSSEGSVNKGPPK